MSTTSSSTAPATPPGRPARHHHRFSLQWFDWGRATDKEKSDIGHVYAHVFEHDIGLVFNPALDSDFVTPLKYYSVAAKGAFVVARDDEDGGRIVGTGALRHLTDLPGFQAEIKRMFFLPVCRGHRLGHVMARMLIDKAREIGFDAVVLDTKKRLAAANRIYELSGFVDCENYNANPRADRWMRLRLKDSTAQSKL